MKIGKQRIKGLVQRNIASGLAYYWQPDAREKAAGWQAFACGDQLEAAIAAANKRNAEIATWRAGGAAPREVRRYTASGTFGALLDRYERDKLSRLSANSQRVDRTQIKYLREWAGKQPVKWISRARVRALRDAICPGGPGTPGHNPAFKLLSKGREIFAWATDEGHFAGENPFLRFNLAKPAPRQQIWEPDARALLDTAAAALGLPSIGFAARLAVYYGQREADILGLTPASWKEISRRQLRMDGEIYDALKSGHGPDAGKVMGLYVKQGKTARWVGVPIEGAMRDEIEAAIAAAHARASAAEAEGKPVALASLRLVANDRTGEPWNQRDFIKRFGQVRAHAATRARKGGDEDAATRIEASEFRDFRRTCVVALGELGMDDAAIAAITGHKLATIKTILETYMPRTEAMAARGVIARIGPRARDAAEKEKMA